MAEAREPGDDQDTYGIPVAELLRAEIDPVEWVIPGYVQEQTIAVLAGPPGVGKTLLAYDWCAQAVAAGKQVFIGQNEGGLRSLQDRLRRACVAAGIPDPPGRFTYRRNIDMALSDLRGVRQFADEMRYQDIVLLDSLSSFWPGLNENDPEHMSMVAEALKVICEAGPATLGNHHTTKTAWRVGEKPSLADIRGHGALAGRIDAAFICRPSERAAGVVRFELHVVKQRDEDWSPPRACEVLMTGPAATFTSGPVQERGRSMARPTDHREREIEQGVLLVVPDDEVDAMSLNAILTKVKKAKPDVTAAVKRLYGDGKLQQDWNGRFYRMKARPSDFGRNGEFHED
jgi:hypothetical protein